MKVEEVRVTPLDENGAPSGPARTLPGVTDIQFRKESETADVPLLLEHLATVSLLTAGRLLGMGRTKTYRLNKVGEFPVRVRDIAGELRVRLKDIEEFLDS